MGSLRRAWPSDRIEKFAPPAADVVVMDDFVQAAQAGFAFDRIHFQRLTQALAKIGRVVRVGQQRAVQFGGGAGELG